MCKTLTENSAMEELLSFICYSRRLKAFTSEILHSNESYIDGLMSSGNSVKNDQINVKKAKDSDSDDSDLELFDIEPPVPQHELDRLKIEQERQERQERLAQYEVELELNRKRAAMTQKKRQERLEKRVQESGTNSQASSQVSATKNVMSENAAILHQNLEKTREAADTSERLNANAKQFSDLSRRIKEKSQSWF